MKQRMVTPITMMKKNAENNTNHYRMWPDSDKRLAELQSFLDLDERCADSAYAEAASDGEIS